MVTYALTRKARSNHIRSGKNANEREIKHVLRIVLSLRERQRDGERERWTDRQRDRENGACGGGTRTGSPPRLLLVPSPPIHASTERGAYLLKMISFYVSGAGCHTTRPYAKCVLQVFRTGNWAGTWLGRGVGVSG